MHPEDDMRWSTETDRTLREVGWHPGRTVCTKIWESALLDHGGLGIAPNGTIYSGRESVHPLTDTGDAALEKLVEGVR